MTRRKRAPNEIAQMEHTKDSLPLKYIQQESGVRTFMLIIQGYVCTLPGSYNREIFLFVLCYTN